MLSIKGPILVSASFYVPGYIIFRTRIGIILMKLILFKKNDIPLGTAAVSV